MPKMRGCIAHKINTYQLTILACALIHFARTFINEGLCIGADEIDENKYIFGLYKVYVFTRRSYIYL